MILVLSTIHEKKKAVLIGDGLLKERLIACYNMISVQSAFWWKGKIEKTPEQLLIMKAPKKNFKKIESYIKKHSGYEVPEVVAISPAAVHAPYFAWVKAETK